VVDALFLRPLRRVSACCIAGTAILGCPAVRLLDRYLFRELLIPLTYCLGGFLLFWVSADLISNLDKFQEDRMRIRDVFVFYVFKTPEFLSVVMPVALLLALLYTITNHARHHELTAMRAAGLSLWRICLPYFVVGLLLSVLVYLLGVRWLEDSIERSEQIQLRRVAHVNEDAGRVWEQNVNFRNDREDRVWRIRAFHRETGEMRDVWVDWRLPDGGRAQLLAERGERVNQIWRFQQVRLFVPQYPEDPAPRQQVMDALAMPEFSETLGQIRSQIKINQLSRVTAARRVRLTVDEIHDYKYLHPNLRPETQAMLDTQLHAALAAPWTCLVVVLIAVPFGAPSGRRNVFVGVSCSIFVCFLYYLCQRLGLALGTSGYMAPVLAAWLPNGLFSLAGIILTSRVR
jgi:lipopolysaccharide export system permease protein